MAIASFAWTTSESFSILENACSFIARVDLGQAKPDSPTGVIFTVQGPNIVNSAQLNQRPIATIIQSTLWLGRKLVGGKSREQRPPKTIRQFPPLLTNSALS